MNRAAALKAAFAAVGLSGRVALALAAGALVLIALSSPSLIAALVAPPPEAPSAAEAEAQGRRPDFPAMAAQIDGRSLFFVPAAPPPPPPAQVERGPDPPPPAPARYGGPALMAMLGDTVWFADGKVLKVGEDAGTLRVVSLDPPWSAQVQWQGVEFTVALYERDTTVMPERHPEAPAGPTPPEGAGETPPGPIASDAGEPSDAPPTPAPPTPQDGENQ